ncbi:MULTISPECIES: ATP synthase F0 subunit B [Streptomyces]|uniref:ATP synthase F0 subunit B n=1 Tax=Streptomyces TaxID=1883 RepID=UPI001B38ABDD|nr:ATP synthase F0 subunit B [Streptomyces sp. C3-3]MBQ1117021.1 ATP synthase F0 subunit B [Streptomyces sp. C3-3]
MTRQDYEDGQRSKPTLTAGEKAVGFAAVMNRVRGHSEQKRGELRLRTEAIMLGTQAYALGHEYLGRGEIETARRWLKVAAGHRVPGSEQALEELEETALRQATDAVTDSTACADARTGAAAAAAVSDETSTCGFRVIDGQQRLRRLSAWAADGGRTPQEDVLYYRASVEVFARARREADAIMARARQEAQTQADEITAQARRDADAILAQARQEAGTAAAARVRMMRYAQKDRASAADLLSQAYQQATLTPSSATPTSVPAWHSPATLDVTRDELVFFTAHGASGAPGPGNVPCATRAWRAAVLDACAGERAHEGGPRDWSNVYVEIFLHSVGVAHAAQQMRGHHAHQRIRDACAASLVTWAGRPRSTELYDALPEARNQLVHGGPSTSPWTHDVLLTQGVEPATPPVAVLLIVSEATLLRSGPGRAGLSGTPGLMGLKAERSPSGEVVPGAPVPIVAQDFFLQEHSSRHARGEADSGAEEVGNGAGR